jgi:hypothetical protein
MIESSCWADQKNKYTFDQFWVLTCRGNFDEFRTVRFFPSMYFVKSKRIQIKKNKGQINTKPSSIGSRSSTDAPALVHPPPAPPPHQPAALLPAGAVPKRLHTTIEVVLPPPSRVQSLFLSLLLDSLQVAGLPCSCLGDHRPHLLSVSLRACSSHFSGGRLFNKELWQQTVAP